MKTCYYELLGVEITASDSDLKKAYRKKALQYHPDKNPGNIEEATAVFANIRAAYEVLADPQERAWYDSHKQQILSEDIGNFNAGDGSDDDYEVDVSVTGITTDDLLKFFNTSLYSRVDDSPAGFYQIAGKVFAKLATEEVQFGRMQGLPKYDHYQDVFFESDILNLGYCKACSKYTSLSETSTLFPLFGDSGARFQDLRVFYRDWSSFNTVKTFSWKDEYMYSRNYDRRTKREIKKRNEKLRQQAKSEYNKTVKRFVTFIKKFDTRMKDGAAKYEEEKRKKMREDLQKQIEKDKQANLKNTGDPFKLQSWQTVEDYDWTEVEKQYDSGNDSDNGKEGSQDEILVYECFICNKTFKSLAQLENHHSTKIHKKKLQQVQREMQKDNMTLGLDAVSDVEEFNSANEEVVSDKRQMELDEIDAELKRIEKELEGISDEENTESEGSDWDLQGDAETGSLESGSAKLNCGDKLRCESEPESESEFKSKPEVEINNFSSRTGQFAVDDEIDNDFDVVAKDSAEADELSVLLASLNDPQEASDEIDEDWNMSKSSKKLKKKKAKTTTSVPTSETNHTPIFQCGVCATKHATRNALFAHIKQESHAAPAQKSKTKKKSKTPKK
ncbi:LANO_0C07954g1_1 [Lachancea nothofagi CBS 11611]|uniref:LANO_0C07954g1_1 n=1 Tax=Lachancea nothofagi CBS 11611 TaxID=1266666 RepID=A0A1G4J8V6_9SACH|nr:LANO_0C07954g1_1 [Lachancea nothofagi CBS 11611]